MRYIEEILDHAVFFARHFQLEDPAVVITAMLLELGLPTQNLGYYYLKDAILLSYTRPVRALSLGLYAEVAGIQGPGVTAEQVEKAITSAIAEAWTERDEGIWRCYFDWSCRYRKPTNMVFVTRLGRFLELWLGCCKGVSHVS